MVESPDRAPPRYRAFLSYCHRDERACARLHRWLESYRAPLGDVSEERRRIRPVFRDRDELASAVALSDTLQKALDESAALIVIGSPAAVASPWVDAEIRYFRRHHPGRPVLAYVVDGDPGRDPRRDPALSALPLALLLADPAQPDGALSEPLAADARTVGDGPTAARLKIAATLLGVRYDDLRRRDFHRRQRLWFMASSFFLVLTGVFAYLAWTATVARDEAQKARAAAELELQSERQTRDFLQSVFRLADPGESRGNAVTVREMLDRAAARIDAAEFARPAIRLRFLESLGRAYAGLGLNRRAVELLQRALEGDAAGLDDEDRRQRVDSTVTLADIEYDMGDYPASLARLDTLNAPALRAATSEEQRLLAQAVRADVLARSDRDADAEAIYSAELDRDATGRSGGGALRLATARLRVGRANLRIYRDELDAAQEDVDVAIRGLEQARLETHPLMVFALNSRAAIAYARKDYAGAATIYARSRSIASRLYDEDSTELGTISNNLGRLLLEAGDLKVAEGLLRSAVHSDRQHRSADFDDLAFSLHNLAYARWALGDATESRQLLEEALPIAEAAKHRMLGPILLALADLDCSATFAARGRERAERAVAVETARVGSDAWTTAMARLAAGYCRVRSGERVEPDGLSAALGVVQKNWSAPSPFRVRADAQWRVIERNP